MVLRNHTHKRTYAVILGTRPEFIKAASLFHAAREHPQIELLAIHTGQHFDTNMSTVFFEELELPKPIASLTISGDTYSQRLGGMFSSLENTLINLKDTLSGVLLIGDVNSVLAGAIVASKLHIPIMHIESGLRSFDQRMPEEFNRIIVDHLSELLFTTEESANQNLAHEGILKEKIRFVGNVGISSLELFRHRFTSLNMHEKLGLTPGTYMVATVHRQEHTSNPEILKNIFIQLSRINERVPLLLPLHPATRARLQEYNLIHLLTMRVIEPLGYFDFINLISNSRGVLTDSGGIQEEASHLGIPLATLRDNTERPITLTLGSNKLFSTSTLDDNAAEAILAHLSRTDFTAGNIPLWDANVPQRILENL